MGQRSTAIVNEIADTGKTNLSAGLTSADARRRLAELGPNAVVEERIHPLQRILRHFWAPVPWMLEATIVLQVALGQWLTALLIALLLALNVLLGAIQEGRADAALALLKQRLSLKSRVKRDGVWIEAPAAQLVPGDIVQVSLGDVVPADVTLISGLLLVDQSTLTGESIPVETGPGKTAYASGLVRRGEAMARVVATGSRTYFGRTAELVSIAHIESTEQKAVFGVVRGLTTINFVIVLAIVAYALFINVSVEQIALLVLTAMLSGSAGRFGGNFYARGSTGSQDAGANGRAPDPLIGIARGSHDRRTLQ